jgi:hypothetical protein
MQARFIPLKNSLLVLSSLINPGCSSDLPGGECLRRAPWIAFQFSFLTTTSWGQNGRGPFSPNRSGETAAVVYPELACIALSFIEEINTTFSDELMLSRAPAFEARFDTPESSVRVVMNA